MKYIFDPDTFSERAAEIGLPLSSRSAPGASSTIRSLRSNRFIEQLSLKEGTGQNPLNLKILQLRIVHLRASAEQRKLKLSPEDYKTFEKALGQAFDALAGIIVSSVPMP